MMMATMMMTRMNGDGDDDEWQLTRGFMPFCPEGSLQAERQSESKDMFFKVKKIHKKILHVQVNSWKPFKVSRNRSVKCPSSKHLYSWAQGITQEYDDRKSTTERTLSAPWGLLVPLHHFSHQLTFHRPFHFLFTTLVATRLCRCLLPSDYVWVVMPWRLAPCDLGDPGESLVSMVLLLLSLTFWYGLVILMFFLLFLLPYHVEMIQSYHLLHQLTHELAPVTPRFFLGVLVAQLVGRRSCRRGQTAGGDSIPRWSARSLKWWPAERQRAAKKNLSRLGLAVLFCVAVFCVALVGLLLVLVFGLFVVTSWRPTGLCTGPLPVHSWGPSICRRPCVCVNSLMKPILQHAIERVERPGGSHEGVGRKKNVINGSWQTNSVKQRIQEQLPRQDSKNI